MSARQMKGELRAGERDSEEGKVSAAERCVMAFRERAVRPQRADCQDTWVVLERRVVLAWLGEVRF